LSNRLGLKRWFLFVMCLVLIVARFRWPAVKVDSTTVWLLLIAALVFLLPEVKAIIPYIRKLKVAGVEVELREDLVKLASEVDEARKSVAEIGAASASQEAYSSIDGILRETSKDPRAALLLLASKLEEQVRNRMNSNQQPFGHRFRPLPQMVEEGIKAGLFPEEVLPAFRDFWNIRNRVAHGEAFEVSNASIVSLISLGTELLKLVSTEGTLLDTQG
jgi:hypothetical protein